MTVLLIYQDVNNTIQNASLLDYNVEREEVSAKRQTEHFGTFEFHLKNVLQYQVCIF